MLSRGIYSAIALLCAGKFGVCEKVEPNAATAKFLKAQTDFREAKQSQVTPGDPFYSGRMCEAIKLWDLPRLDDALDGKGSNQAYLLTSASAIVDDKAAQANLFVASLNNLVYPAVTYAYFDVKANYGLAKDSGHYSFGVGASATGMAAVMTRLFQFQDKNNDGSFTEGEDTVIDEYPFAIDYEKLGYPGPKHPWDGGEFDDQAKSATIKTKDGVFSVTLKANEKNWTTPGGFLMTPANTKVDIFINYPNLAKGNLVGLEAYIVSSTGTAKGGVQVGQGLYVEQPEDHPTLGFGWDGDAKLESDGSSVTVKASGVLDANLDKIKGKDLIIGGIGLKAKVDAGATLDVKKMVFAFNQGKAGNVFWDPSIGISSPEDSLVSGAGGITRWTSMLLALLLPMTSLLFAATH